MNYRCPQQHFALRPMAAVKIHDSEEQALKIAQMTYRLKVHSGITAMIPNWVVPE